MNSYQYTDEKGDYRDYWEIVNENGELCKEIEELESKINKAIEYIEQIFTIPMSLNHYVLLEILKGE